MNSMVVEIQKANKRVRGLRGEMYRDEKHALAVFTRNMAYLFRICNNYEARLHIIWYMATRVNRHLDQIQCTNACRYWLDRYYTLANKVADFDTLPTGR